MFLDQAKQQSEVNPDERIASGNDETSQAQMERVSAAIGSILSMHDVAAVLDGIAAAVERVCDHGHLRVRHAQEVANMLTRLQLALNELQRVELQEHGSSAEMAEWFVALQNGIRAIRDTLYQEVAAPQGMSRREHR